MPLPGPPEPRRVLVINAHPDPDPARLCSALSQAYAEGAEGAGFSVERVEIGAMDFAPIRSQREYEHDAPPAAIAASQASLARASHVVLVLPIWLGGPPSRLVAWLEQTLRPGFAREVEGPGKIGRAGLKGRSVRIIATMGMPALAYRFYFWGHGLANLRRAVLGFVGFAPIRTTLVGGAGAVKPDRARELLAQMRALGAAGA
jgi:putative NADPH-quinone reductase